MATVEAVNITLALDPYMSLRALSAYSGLSARTLRGLLRGPDGIPHFRLGPAGRDGRRGARILVRVGEFDRWLLRHRQQQAPPPRDVGSILEQAAREVAGRVGGTRDNRRGKAKPRKGTGAAARAEGPSCGGVAPEAGSRGTSPGRGTR